MRLLVLGALGPYPERMLAFTQDGHRLWHLATEWLPEETSLVPWERLERFALDATADDRAAQALAWVERYRIDAVYSLLNVWDGSPAVTAAFLRAGASVPVVRHYKEQYLSPDPDEQTCLEQSRGVIFLNDESRDFFARQYRLPARTLCLDGDPIPARYHAGTLQPKLSAVDGVPRLLLAGTATDDGSRYDYRPLVAALTTAGAHVHLYGQFRRLQPSGQMANVPAVAGSYHAVGVPGRLHLHAPIPPAQFVERWSPYDAGLLHVPAPGDAFRALNLPNRYSAYLAAGLPMALPAAEMPALERHLADLGTPALLYREPTDLLALLPDPAAGARALAARPAATFEAGYSRLTAFLESCLAT